MAQKVNIVLVDDLDGTEADETVSFSLDGKDYEIDLTSENADRLRGLLAPYVGHARKAGGRRRAGSGRSGGAGQPSASEVRDWARSNGYDVSERGRVPAEIRDAYAAAH